MGGAKPLKKEQQQQIHSLITKEGIQSLFEDPFGLNKSDGDESNSLEDEDSRLEDIDF